MDAIIDAIKTEPETYYVIITDLPNSLRCAGYMPLKSDFAFLFTRESSDGSPKSAYQSIAHELGHGAFYLKHIDDEYKINDATDNLMNRYAAGTTLWKPQWDWIGDPSWRLYMFQKEEEGASYNGIFFTPDWKPFIFTTDLKAYDFSESSSLAPKGTVRSLFYNELGYEANFENNKFLGYKNGEKSLDLSLYQSAIPDDKEVYLIEYIEGTPCSNKVYSFKYKDFGKIKEGVSFSNSLTTFKYHLICGTNSNTPCIENYKPDNPGSIALFIHSTVTSDCLNSWSIEKRFSLIKVLAKHIGTKWEVGGEYDTDEAILKILASAPSNQIEAILDILKTEGIESPVKKTYLSTFVNEMDEDALVYFGQWHNNCLIKQEIAKKRSDYNTDKDLVVLNQGRSINIGQSRYLIKYRCAREGDKIKLTEYFTGSEGLIIGRSSNTEEACKKIKLSDPFLLDPDQIVILHLSSDFTLGLETRYNSGDEIALTSLALWALFEEKKARDLSVAIKVVAMVVTLPTAMEGGWAGSLAIIDNVVLGSSLIIDDTNLKSKVKTEEGKIWLQRYESFVSLYFLGRAAIDLPLALKNLDNSYLDWREARALAKEKKGGVSAEIAEDVAIPEAMVPFKKIILSNSGKLNVLEFTNLSKTVASGNKLKIGGVAFKTTDEYVDVIVHSSNQGYVVSIDNIEYAVSESTLAEIITKNVPSDKTVRLLSCSDLASAKKLSGMLNNREIVASDEVVKLYSDGTVESGNWYSIKGDKQTEVINFTPSVKSTDLRSFISLGEDAAKTGDKVSNTIKYVDNYNVTSTGKIAEIIDRNGEVIGTLYKQKQFATSTKLQYSYKYKTPTGNVKTLKQLTSELTDDFIEFDFNIPKELKGQGLGSTVFDDAIKYYDIKNPGYKGIRGRWEGSNPNYVDGMSDNFKSFKEAKLSNKTPVESAFATWTGQQAIKHEFTKAKVITDENDLIIVEFTK